MDYEFGSDENKKNWKLFLRQLLVISGQWTCYFDHGLVMGSFTVLVPQLRKTEQDISVELASWLPTTYIYSAIPWMIILSYLCTAIGRKRTQIFSTLSTLIGLIFFYFSNSTTYILISSVFQGATAASHLTICLIIITEYSSKKHRGLYLTIKSASYFWGLLVANATGAFSLWRNIPIIGIVCSIYSLTTAMFWPESPYWLANKGRFEECAAAHRWLKGNTLESEEELAKLLRLKDEYREIDWRIKKVCRTMFQRQIIKPILLGILLVCLYTFSGKWVLSVFALEVLQKITNNEKTAYSGMLILDGVAVFSMYLGCGISKIIKRRTMLLIFTSAGIVSLIIISGFLYLVKLSILDENKYILLSLLSVYSICMSCGPIILSTSIIGELLPLHMRAFSTFSIACFMKIINGSFLKISPYLFINLTMHGTFLLYAILSSAILILLYYYMPETKDKTLHEISDNFKSNIEKEVGEAATLMSVQQKDNVMRRN